MPFDREVPAVVLPVQTTQELVKTIGNIALTRFAGGGKSTF